MKNTKLRAAGSENFGTSPVMKPAGFCLGAQKNAALKKYPGKEKPWGGGGGQAGGFFLFPRNANFTLYGKTSPGGGSGGFFQKAVFLNKKTATRIKLR